MTQEALKQALDALETSQNYVQASSLAGYGDQLDKADEAIAAIKEALAQLEQEPVAIVTGDAWETDIRFLPEGMALPPDTKLYTHPPQRTWVGLTNEEIDSYFEDHGYSPSEGYYPVIKDVEAKFKENNG